MGWPRRSLLSLCARSHLILASGELNGAIPERGETHPGVRTSPIGKMEQIRKATLVGAVVAVLILVGAAVALAAQSSPGTDAVAI